MDYVSKKIRLGGNRRVSYDHMEISDQYGDVNLSLKVGDTISLHLFSVVKSPFTSISLDEVFSFNKISDVTRENVERLVSSFQGRVKRTRGILDRLHKELTSQGYRVSGRSIILPNRRSVHITVNPSGESLRFNVSLTQRYPDEFNDPIHRGLTRDILYN